jgi:hypothetical protein
MHHKSPLMVIIAIAELSDPLLIPDRLGLPEHIKGRPEAPLFVSNTHTIPRPRSTSMGGVIARRSSVRSLPLQPHAGTAQGNRRRRRGYHLRPLQALDPVCTSPRPENHRSSITFDERHRRYDPRLVRSVD